MKAFVKTIIFIIAWVLSFTCGIYLLGAIMGNAMPVLDIVMTACGFTLAVLWMWFNTVRI